MAKYRITAPDGHTYEVTAPDGATEQDVMAYAQANYQPQKADFSGVTASVDSTASAPSVTDGMSGVDRFMAGVGKSIVDTGHGLKQAGTSMAEYFARTNPALVGDDTAANLRASLERQYAEQADRDKRDTPLMDTGAGLAGNLTGVVGQVIGPGGLAKLATRVPQIAASAAAPAAARAGAAFLPRTLTGNAVQGAAFGAAQPTTSDAGRAINAGVGGLAGFGGAAAPRLVGASASGVASLIPAVSQRAQTRAAGQVLNQFAENPAAIRAAAMNPQMIVPGSLPTLAEASGDVGLAGLQRTLANTPEFGNALTLRQQGNNLARVRAIEGAFGGADDAAADSIRVNTRTAELPGLKEAKRQTGAESGRIIAWIDRVGNSTRFRGNPQVEQALGTVRNMVAVPIDDAGRLSAARSVVTESLNNPRRMSSADFDAVREARRLVIGGQQQGRTADEVLRDLRKLKPKSMAASATINDMSRALKVAERGKPDVASLYETRKYITGTLMSRADGATMEALRGVVKQLDARIGEVAPTYKQYLTNYAAGMREADRVAVGAELLGTGRAVRTATNDPALTPAAFGRAAGNLDRTVQRATGFSRATADKVLTAEQRGVVDAVRRDLERYSRATTDGKAIGSNSVQNAIGGNSFQSAVGPVGAAVVEPVSGIALMGLNQMRAKFGGKVAGLVEEAMLDPARAAEILAAVPAGQRSEVIRAAARLIPRVGGAAGAAVIPATE